MGVRISIVALICALVALVAFAPATARPAAASCLIVKFPLDTAAKGAETVIVGEVIGERGGEDLYSGYESTIRVLSALKGKPGQEITLSPLSFGKCGPRLMTGERVLLFISGPHRTALYESGKYLLAEGEARTKHFPPIPADDALRRVAAITGATDEQLDAALAFARVGLTPALQPDAEPLPTDAPLPDAAPLPVDVEEDGGQPALLIALASALLALLVAALAGLGLRRAR